MTLIIFLIKLSGDDSSFSPLDMVLALDWPLSRVVYLSDLQKNLQRVMYSSGFGVSLIAMS